ncbi:hypothetical protein DUZ99_15850 [Xylanibacillus composti]|uniref:Uncharacterized protein n=1 Tax=Xylanibacillus composti TaxID=1572762 RepID=A0A8J4H5L6_9BACL|nr:hypothetical protein [Xylanibacillus composti]MDT9726456.1 hypothetical protein [Xylanibacillus composti]GIQ71387.1 hypothetical protein XYCOK13_42110 [Xylanibacillus composti]
MEKEKLLLRSDRLAVELERPGTVYRGSRFDWSGWVSAIVLDGEFSFASVESTDPGQGSGGYGLCNEFGIEQAIGYADCPVGGQFPKLGVGLITRQDDGDYNFYKPQPVEPFAMSAVQEAEDRVRFEAEPRDCRGYAARLSKIVSVADNRLRIDYKLDNVGEHAIATDEYGHNFIHLNGEPVGPDYELTLPFDLKQAGELQPVFQAEGPKLSWREQPDRDFYLRLDTGLGGESQSWTLTHKRSGIGMKEILHAPLYRFALWGRGYVVSPEMFVRIQLAPGDSMTWSREYEFFKRA